MKVIAFHAAIPSVARDEWLIDKWRETWSQHGWTPVLLDRSCAERHPKYQGLQRTLQRMPASPNGWDWEATCFLRWLATAEAAKGEPWVFAGEYDVLNFGVRPEQIQAGPKMGFTDGHTVSPAVFGTPRQFESLVDALIATDFTQITPAYEMWRVAKWLSGGEGYYQNVGMQDLFKEGWERAKLVHFSTSFLVLKGLRREQKREFVEERIRRG